MEANEYQKKAMETVAFPAGREFTYLALAQISEAGELADKLAPLASQDPHTTEVLGFLNALMLATGQAAKDVRGDTPELDMSHIQDVGVTLSGEPETVLAIAHEIGDQLWNLAVLAEYIGFSLEDIMAMNVAKLASRSERNAIKGSGDNR